MVEEVCEGGWGEGVTFHLAQLHHPPGSGCD